MNAQKFNLNLVPGGVEVYIQAAQFEAGRPYEATMWDGDELYVFDGTESVTIRGTKANGKGFSVDMTDADAAISAPAGGSVLTFKNTKAMTDAAGPADVSFILSSGDIEIGTINVRMRVQRDGLQPDTIIHSDSFGGIIEGAVADYLEEHGIPIEAEAQTLPAGSSATATYENGVLTIGVPRGATGATGARGPAGAGFPAGGSTDQVLAKQSDDDYDADWEDPPEGGGGLGFTDWSFDENGYLHLVDDDDQDVLDPLYIGGGGSGGGGADSVVRIVRSGSRERTIVDTEDSCILSVTWSSLDSTSSDPTGNGSASWYVGGSRVAVQNVPQGSYSFDIRNYLTDGSTNTVRLTIEDSYGTTKSMSWDITVTTFGLTWNLADVGYDGEDDVTARIIPNGTGDKTVNVTVDGTSIYSEVISTSGRTIAVTIPAQSHGAHTVRAWMTATVGGETVTSDILTHVGIWTEDGVTTPVIAVEDTAFTVQQFGTKNIKYMVYDPQNETVNVTRAIDGTTDAIIAADRTKQTWSYRPTVTGSHTLTLTAGSVTATMTVTVSSTGYNIHEVAGAVVDIDPTGHTNNEAGAANFGYKDANGTMHTFNYSSNFDWLNGGFQQDENGITAFVVKRGTYVRLDRSLFNDNAKSGNGKEIKVVFKSTNVRSYDAELMNGTATGVGLTINANAATIKSMQETIDALYCENEKIELDINIEPSAEGFNRFATVWMEGIVSGIKVYSTDDSWTQSVPATFKIGSDDCDVWLYRLKMYDTCLTRYDILDNFIADCSDPDEMIDRYERNDIFSGNAVDINALANARPNLRIIRISADRLTTGKEDPVTTKIEHIYRSGGTADNWTAVGAIHKAQGTSSLAYGLAALNLDIDMSGATSWTDAEGGDLTSYAMTANSIPVSYFNIKLNVASSENANNVLLADDYNTYQPWLSPARKANPKVRDTVEGHPCAVFFTNTSSATITVGSHTVAPGETIFYGCGDMNNSKKNRAVFGQDTSQWSEQCCIEITNNNNPQCLFKSDDLTDETWGDKDGDSFEFRYGESTAAKAKLQELLTWMVSVDASEATGDALGRVVNIGGTAYANDTAAYRVAKFRAEVGDYFAVDSILYHYLFTERHCMVDNRAKNCFISYEYDSTAGKYLWNFTKDYDNDTADGNDNSGGLTFTYGLEDTDSVNSAPVFNASRSALWCMVRDYMQSELAAMFQSRESEGAWSASRILQKFEDYQSARPEALVNEDMWAKYITPYLASGETSYFEMLYGTKKDQRRQFETYQEIYMATKYSSSLASSSRIEFRGTVPDSYAGVTPSGDMTITPYCDMYVTVQYGNAGTVKVRAKRGVATAVSSPAPLDDTETYIYAAPYITGLAGLAGLYSRKAALSSAVRLTRLELGSGAAGYSNDRLQTISLGNNTMLEYIDLRGTPNLVQGLDLSGLPGLKELYVSNSGVTGVTFAVGAIIETAVLPSILTLTARSLLRLTTLTCSASSLSSIWIENTPSVDSYAIVAAANLTTGRLVDVNWTNADADVILNLTELAGLDENGDTIPQFVLTGSCYIEALTAAELATIQAAFPYLAITYGSIVNSYTVNFVDWDGTTLYTESVRSGGTAKDPVQKGYIPTPTRAATVDTVYEYLGWDTALGPITLNTTITASYESRTRRYTVTWMYDAATVLYTESIAAYGTTRYDGPSNNCPSELTPPESGQIWVGWDTLTNSIVEDTVVTAEFVTPVMPSAVPSTYDYIYSEDPADNSALTFAEFYGVIYNGQASRYFTLGDKIKIVPNTTVFADSSIILQLEAFHHFTLASDDTTFAETTWGMVGLMNAGHSMNGSATNVGGWPSCGMRTWLNNTIFNALPQRWKAVIKSVNVLSSKGGTSADIVSSQDKLWLRSQAEVGFDTTATPYKDEIASGADQVRFSAYSSNANRIKKYYNNTGTAAYWWLRSPVSTSSAYYCSVRGDGIGVTSNGATASYCVSFGFCI